MSKKHVVIDTGRGYKLPLCRRAPCRGRWGVAAVAPLAAEARVGVGRRALIYRRIYPDAGEA